MAASSGKPASKPDPAAKKPPPAKGKAAPDSDKKDETAKAPAAPKSVLQRYRMFLFAGLGTAMLATLATASWVVYFRAPVEVDPPAPPPPALKPTPPTVVREGDLDDDLWRRMGVRPNSN